MRRNYLGCRVKNGSIGSETKVRNKNAAVIKRAGSLFISFVVFFLIFSAHSKAENNYSPIHAEIPFRCEKTIGEKEVPYLITLKSVSPNAPLPESNRMTVTGGESKNFGINITEPGTYIYRIGQEKGSVQRAVYDEKEYDVYLYVINSDKNELSYSLSVVQVNSDEKPDQVIFQNRMEKEPDKPDDDDSPKQDEPADPNKADSANKNLRTDGLFAGKTGEINSLYIGVYIVCMLALLAGAGVYVAVRKKTVSEIKEE